MTEEEELKLISGEIKRPPINPAGVHRVEIATNPPGWDGDPDRVAKKIWKVLEDIQRNPSKIVETYHQEEKP